MTPADRVVLLALLRAGPTTAHVVAATTGRGHTQTHHRLTRLERAGLVSRGPHRYGQGGRRLGQVWEATPEGRRLAPRAGLPAVTWDVVDSLIALGGTATGRQLTEDTGRSRETVIDSLRRAGAQKIGRERGSTVWTLCSGADTL